MIRVLSPGLMTTVQDGGRRGWQQFGVPVCGAMDEYSLALANRLVDNEPDEAALEITLLGPSLRFEVPCVFAVCGGEFEMKLDGQVIEPARAYAASFGAVLEIGPARQGARAYLAVAGGFDLPIVLGSRSTSLKGGFGGYEGRRLLKDDQLPLRAPMPWLPFMEYRVLERELRQYPLEDRPARVVLGPQQERFSGKGVETFLSGSYRLTGESDRMGYRLEGPAIEYAPGCDGNIISDGVVMGAVQVPSGQPIVMMADRQTTGGYAKIAVVISADLPLLAQKKAGDTVRFSAVEPRAAIRLWKKQQSFLRNLDFCRDYL